MRSTTNRSTGTRRATRDGRNGHPRPKARPLGDHYFAQIKHDADETQLEYTRLNAVSSRGYPVKDLLVDLKTGSCRPSSLSSSTARQPLKRTTNPTTKEPIVVTKFAFQRFELLAFFLGYREEHARAPSAESIERATRRSSSAS